MDLPRLEHDIRHVPGVLACQVSGGEVVVLVAPDADADAVSGAVAAVLTAAAASPIVRVVGGRAPIVPMRRHGRRAVAALSAGAAALVAAGVAAATNGVFTPDRRDRPSASNQVAAPPTTRGAALAPSTSPSGHFVGDELGPERRARSTSLTTMLPSGPGIDANSNQQLATPGVGTPAVLSFDIPLPGEVAVGPVPNGPKKEVPVGPPPTVAATVPDTTTTVAPPTTTLPSIIVGMPSVSSPTTTTLPSVIVGMPSLSSPTTWLDQHDNDRGERGDDSNGHDTKGPQRGGGHGHGG